VVPLGSRLYVNEVQPGTQKLTSFRMRALLQDDQAVPCSNALTESGGLSPIVPKLSLRTSSDGSSNQADVRCGREEVTIIRPDLLLPNI
jgi:hypothetical protein